MTDPFHLFLWGDEVLVRPKPAPNFPDGFPYRVVHDAAGTIPDGTTFDAYWLALDGLPDYPIYIPQGHDPQAAVDKHRETIRRYAEQRRGG